MKKLILFLLLLIPALANAAVTASCTFYVGAVSGVATNGSPATLSDASIVAPVQMYKDCNATTSNFFPAGTSSGMTVTAQLNQGATVIGASGGSGTINGNAVFTATTGTGTAVMTISGVTSGAVSANSLISGGTLSGTTKIVSFGTFNGTSGTVNLSKADTWTNSTTVTESNGDWVRFDNPVNYNAGSPSVSGYKLNGAVSLAQTSISVNTGVGCPAKGSFIRITTNADANQYLVLDTTPTPASCVPATGISAVTIQAPGILKTEISGAVVFFIPDANDYPVIGTLAAGTFTIGGYGLIMGRGDPTTVGSMTTNGKYVITATGGSDFTVCGAANSLPNTIFTATNNCAGAGGTGTANGGGTGGSIFAGTPITLLANFNRFTSIQYEDSYGDQSSGAWPNGTANLNKNYGTGALGAHLFEKPGVYTVYTRVTDTPGTIGQTVSATVTVLDPDIVFVSNTACVDNVAGHTAGCTGTEIVSSDPVTALTTAIGANGCGAGNPCRRIRFNRGDIFHSATATYTLNTAGPGIIGAYGSGSAPVLSFDSNSGTDPCLIINGTSSTDWKIMDLYFTTATGATNSRGIDPANSKRLLILRNTFSNMGSDVVLSAGTITADLTAVVENRFLHASTMNEAGYGMFISGASRLMIMGNYINISDTAGKNSHNVRLQQANGFVFEHNTSYGCDGTDACGSWLYDPLLVHSASLENHAVTDTAILTQYGIISDNSFSHQAIQFGSESTATMQSLGRILYERNMYALAGGNPSSGAYRALDIQNQHMMVRNSVFDLTGTRSHWAAYVNYTQGQGNGSPVPKDISFINNTIVSNDAGALAAVAFSVSNYIVGGMAGVYGVGCYGNDVENNLAWTNGDTTATNIGTTSPCSLQTGASGTFGNSSTVQMRNASGTAYSWSTMFSGAQPPTTALDVRLLSGNYACDGTTNSPQDLWPSSRRDFLNCGPKIGANICAGAMVPAASAMCFGAAQ